MSRNAARETMVFLDSFRLCVYHNQFLVAVSSTRSRHARSAHTVLVRVYLQGYGPFIQIFLGEVQFATLCEDTTVQSLSSPLLDLKFPNDSSFIAHILDSSFFDQEGTAILFNLLILFKNILTINNFFFIQPHK